MSWDLSVDAPSGSMGTPEEVRKKIADVFSFVDWSDPSMGVVQEAGYTLEFSFDDFEDEEDEGEAAAAGAPVAGFMICVRGGGEPLLKIVKLCKANGWSLGDTGSGEEIDLDNPSNQGWKDFQAFRDKAAGSASGSKPGFFARLFGRKA